MALSEKEKDWLEWRKNLCNRCAKAAWCRTGEKHGYNTERCRFWEIKVPNQGFIGRFDEDFQDAAEFEARVQKWLMYQYEKAYQCKEVSDGFLPDRGTMLMFARLAVEAEMDK